MEAVAAAESFDVSAFEVQRKFEYVFYDVNKTKPFRQSNKTSS